MGIDVDESGRVFYVENDHRMIDSRLTHNPVVQSVHGLKVVSVFRRVRTKSKVSDGNPLIYALKSSKGYSIETEDILAFMPEFRAVMAAVAQIYTVDFVVPIPSHSIVSSMFASRVSRILRAPIQDSWIEKKLNRDVCNDLDFLLRSNTLTRSNRRDLLSVRSSLGKSLSTVFSMKQLDASVRPFFDPFKWVNHAPVTKSGRVLLVDDLLSTGTSLSSAKRLFEAKGFMVECLCLLSSTGGYQRVALK